jgi:hypothetical protein
MRMMWMDLLSWEMLIFLRVDLLKHELTSRSHIPCTAKNASSKSRPIRYMYFGEAPKPKLARQEAGANLQGLLYTKFPGASGC